MKRKIARSLVFLFCFLLSLSLVFSGCGGTNSTQSSSSSHQENSSTGIAQEPGESTAKLSGSITYWSHNGPAFIDANKQIIEKYRSKNPDVKINYQNFPFDVLQEKMKASYAAKSESDIQQIFGTWATQYTKYGLFDEVQGLTLENAKSIFYEPCFAGYMYDGKIFGIPREYNIECGGVLYYPDKLKEAGMSNFPTTYDELVTTAQKVTKHDAQGNITQVGFDFITEDNIPYTFLSFILQLGGKYWTDDNKHVVFTSPEAEKSMQALVDLIVKYKVTDFKHLPKTEDTSDYFFKGLSTMCYRGPWTIPVGLDQYKVTNFQYGKMPVFGGGTTFSFAAPTGWGEVVSANSKNKEIAWDFVKFATSDENSALFNAATFTIPAVRAVAESSDFRQKMPMMVSSLDVLANGVHIGNFPNASFFKKTVYDNFERTVQGAQDVKTALKTIEDIINKNIDDAAKQ